MTADKIAADQHLLARVLDDARSVGPLSARATDEIRERELLRNNELFTKYTSLSQDRRLVAYFAKPEAPNCEMQPADIAPITALLERDKKTQDLDLWLNSPGGSAQTAEKIVAACRAKCTGEFRVVVPNMAKSAATMAALCSDQIVMGYLSELGPIDPQVPVNVGGLRRFISAQSFLDGQKLTLDNVAQAQNKKEPVIGYLQLLNAPEMSPSWIAEMSREIKFGQDVVTKHLKQFMMKKLHPGDDATRLGTRASRIARNLSQANKRFSHGRMIGAEECRDDLELNVEILDQDDDRWKVIWEIYVRMEIFLQTHPMFTDDFQPCKVYADAEEIQISG